LLARNGQTESVIIVWDSSGDPLSELQNIQYRLFALLLYKLTDLHLPNYNCHSTQYAAVSQPDMNELAAKKFPVRSANELQTDNCATAGRTTERIVRLCSSVIIQQQYMYFVLIKGK